MQQNQVYPETALHRLRGCKLLRASSQPHPVAKLRQAINSAPTRAQVQDS